MVRAFIVFALNKDEFFHMSLSVGLRVLVTNYSGTHRLLSLNEVSLNLLRQNHQNRQIRQRYLQAYRLPPLKIANF